MDVAQEANEAGLSSKSPPAVRHHRLPPKLLPVGNQGFDLTSYLQKIFSLLISITHHDGKAGSSGLKGSRGLHGVSGASRASTGLQGEDS